MRRRLPTCLGVVFAIGLAIDPLAAQQPPGPAVDREADRLLREMSATLTKAPRFALEAEEVFDEIPDVGPRRSLTSARRIAVERPDRAVADVEGETANRTAWFNHGRLTLLDKDENAYGTIDAPKTIHERVDWAADQYGVYVPLSDLFYPDFYATLMAGVIRGEYLGLQTVNGKPCHHLAFEQETIDWQIWIDSGAVRLPRKLTIAYKSEPGEPQYTVFMRAWNLDPAFPGGMFDFEPPEGATSMEIDALLPQEDESAEGESTAPAGASAVAPAAPATASATPPPQPERE